MTDSSISTSNTHVPFSIACKSLRTPQLILKKLIEQGEFPNTILVDGVEHLDTLDMMAYRKRRKLDWLTATTVAKKIKKSRAWVHKLREKGRFPETMQVGDIYFFSPADVKNYLDNQKKQTPTLTTRTANPVCRTNQENCAG